MDARCLRHPGASTIGTQLLDGDCSYWLVNPGNHAMSPHMKGGTSTHHTELMVKRGKEGKGNT